MSWRYKSDQLRYHRAYDKNRKRRSFAETLKREIGCCERCGYDRCMGALCWHHVFPEFKTTKNLIRLSLQKAARELMFCLLLCENCHREAHQGMWDPRVLLAMRP